MEPILSLKQVTKRFGGLDAVNRVNLQVRAGEFLTLLGPSGCGKTTILRLVAGFEEADEGEILLRGRSVQGVPAHRRPVNTVFQSYALFPHMTAFENVAFGLRIKKTPKKEIESRVHQALRMVKLEGLGSRRVAQLSGGQQQRIAVARAIVNEPVILLLDEPLSALDYRLRKAMQLEIKQLQRQLGITFLYVTHDQEEAMTMSDRIVVMNDGHIEQMGTPKEIYETPVNMFVAHFVGEINSFDSEILETENGRMALNVAGVTCHLTNRGAFSAGQPVKVLLRPEDMFVSRPDEPCDSPHLRGTVQEQIYKGTTVDLTIQVQDGPLIKASQFFNEDAEEISFSRGEAVHVTWIDGWEVVLPDA